MSSLVSSVKALPNLSKLEKYINFIEDEYVLAMKKRTDSSSFDYPFAISNFDLGDHRIFEELQTTLELHHKIEDFVFWKFKKNARLDVHLDTMHGIETPRKEAIVIPIKNCEQLHIRWFKHNDPENIKYLYGLNVPMVPLEDVTRIHSTVLSEPVIITTDVWHDAINNGNETAYFVTIRFDRTLNLQTDL